MEGMNNSAQPTSSRTQWKEGTGPLFTSITSPGKGAKSCRASASSPSACTCDRSAGRGTVSFALGLLHVLGLLHHCSATLSLPCRLPAVRQSLGDLFLHQPWEDPIRQDKGSKAVLSSDDGNVLHAVRFRHRWPMSPGDMASAIEKLNF